MRTSIIAIGAYFFGWYWSRFWFTRGKTSQGGKMGSDVFRGKDGTRVTDEQLTKWTDSFNYGPMLSSRELGMAVQALIEDRRRNGMKATVFRGKDKEWRFKIIAANNEPVAQSEGYKNQRDASAIAVDLVGVENVKVEED